MILVPDPWQESNIIIIKLRGEVSNVFEVLQEIEGRGL